MKKLFRTSAGNWSALLIRVAVGATMFPHGAQKLFGWFGGHGFSDTLAAMSDKGGLPVFIAFLVIMTESIGALMLITGLATRFAAFMMLCTVMGIVFIAHIQNGFFLNWGAAPGVGNGIEYFIPLVGICIALLFTGGGKWSIDSLIVPTSPKKLQMEG